MKTAANSTEATTPGERKRRGRPSGSNDGQPVTRFFAGEIADGRITLSTEFRTEPEAQLNSLKQDSPYFSIEAWKMTPDLTNGTIAVTKRPFINP